MDGTLADVSGIRHYLPNFHKFHTESVNVPANDWVVADLINAHDKGIPIVIVTARSSKFMSHTTWWLNLNGIPFDQMYMRQYWDNRPDREVKEEIVRRMRFDGFNPVKAWDDNPVVVEMWNDLGVPCVVVPGFDKSFAKSVSHREKAVDFPGTRV
jgi:hypothetical protein